jgi:toxin ParE1/3/4
MLRVVYRPEAEAELFDAIQFYKGEADLNGDKFLETIQRHVFEIAMHPLRFPQAGGQIRRCVVRKYPFIIFYRPTPDHVRVLAVAHTSRNPEYWKHRK